MIVNSYLKINNLIKNDRFLKNSLISFLGVFTITLLNYSYHPIVSKLVSVIEYGEIQTILTLLFITSILTTVIRMLIVNKVTNRGEDNDVLTKSLSPIFTLTILVMTPIILLSILGSKYIQGYFYLESYLTVVLFGLYLSVCIPYTFYNSYLQGLDDHKNVSLSNIIISIIKLFATLILLYFGFGVNGVVLALVLSMIGGMLYSFYKVKGIKLEHSSISEAVLYIKKEYNYIADVFMSIGFITIIYSIDILIVKRIFDPLDAGGYGGIATIGKIIFFLTAFISPVISSSVIASKNNNENLKVLSKSFKILLSLCFPLLLIIFLFEKQLVLVLLSSQYLQYSYLLVPMSILSVSLSILYVYISYLLALRHKLLRYLSIFGIMMLYLGISVSGNTMLGVIYVFMITSILLNLVCFYLINYKK